jgi:hypothetical protein
MGVEMRSLLIILTFFALAEPAAACLQALLDLAL